ncbi:hypothetical protein SNE40_010994 [Patella caerulea]|uniref:PX domain-containing protein n=1 Tax=Patella caerulea TaxID=87958 RepID=A0AAN8PVF4_PATCE
MNKTKRVRFLGMLPEIKVLNPRTHNTWEEGRYATYDIHIQTDNKAYRLQTSCSARRYSEFLWLRKKMKTHHPSIKCPPLPPKRYFWNTFGRDFLEERRKGLEDYLNKLQNEMLYLSDVSFHLFVQTSLTTEDIDSFLNGDLSEDDLNQVWLMGGNKPRQNNHGSQLHISTSCPDQLKYLGGSDGDDTLSPDSNHSEGLSRFGNALSSSWLDIPETTSESSDCNSIDSGEDNSSASDKTNTVIVHKPTVQGNSLFYKLGFGRSQTSPAFSINSINDK